MAPKTKPTSLFRLSIKSMINWACINIEKCTSERAEEESIERVKQYLVSKLPAQLLNFLCEERSCELLRVDRRLQVSLLTHPNMTTFRVLKEDNCLSQSFLMKLLVRLTNLTVLDLNSICTDEILGVVGQNCLLLEELNMTAKTSISDSGLKSIYSLKHLRILFMDWKKVGYLESTQYGIREFLKQLPELEELNMRGNCTIDYKFSGFGMRSTMFTADNVSKPLSIEKIDTHLDTRIIDDMKMLLSSCPTLRVFSCSRMRRIQTDEIIQMIGESEWQLTKLELQHFIVTDSFSQLLKLKGAGLIDLSLDFAHYIELNEPLEIDIILLIGECCPLLQSLTIIYRGWNPQLQVSHTYHHRNLYENLQSFTIKCDNDYMEAMLMFFSNCSLGLRRIKVRCWAGRIKNLERCFTQLLEAGLLSQLLCLDLVWDMCLAESLLRNLIQLCDNLQLNKMSFRMELLTDLQNYIRDNNLDVKLEMQHI